MVKLKSLHTDTHKPHPVHFSSLILISAFVFVLEVGIAIYHLFFEAGARDNGYMVYSSKNKRFQLSIAIFRGKIPPLSPSPAGPLLEYLF